MDWIIRKKKNFYFELSKKGLPIVKDANGCEVFRVLGFNSEEISILFNARMVRFIFTDGEEVPVHPLMGQENYFGTKLTIRENGQLVYADHLSSEDISIEIIRLEKDDYILLEEAPVVFSWKNLLRRWIS